ncbi:HEAT repeat domain-containing protein [Archangium gephyra]|uniref:HEAT repeat domain-containing protein n=1 Tax=Archangium gephyra TaxID=48 RepID=UPI0035D5267C
MQPPPTSVTPAALPAAPLPPKPSDGTRAWNPGWLYRYSVLSEQQVSFRQGQPGAPTPQGMLFHLQGDWNVGVVSAGEEKIVLRFQLQAQPSTFAIKIDGQDALTPETRAAMLTGLGIPFFAELDRRGAVKVVYFEQGTDVLVQGLLRALVASTQIVLPGAPQDTWSTEEYDTTGQYFATYQRQGPELRFEKVKQSYSRMATPQGLQPLGTDTRLSVRTRTTFALAEDLWTHTLGGTEHLEVDVGPGMPVTLTELKVDLRLLERREEASLPGTFAARRGSLAPSLLAAVLIQAPDPKDHFRQVLGNRRFEDMLADLRALPTEVKARDDARTQALERLRSLFELEPAEALKVPGVLKGMDPLAASPMLGALSAASTPESIQALSKAIDDASLAPMVRTDAIAALGVAEAPTREGVDTLRRFSQDSSPLLRETATLALGNAAMQMREGDARGAEGLVVELQSAWRSASSPEQQALVLRALGNTQSLAALPTLTEGLRSPSALVREAAVVALRNMPDPSADRLLAERLVGDPEPQVRKSAVFACTFRTLPLYMPVLEQVLRSDPADGVRSDIVTLLGGNRGLLPGADALLSWAGQNDRNPDIRRAALSFLNPTPAPAPIASPSSP